MVSNSQDGKYSTERRFRFFIIFFDIAGFPLIAGKRGVLQRAYNTLVSLCAYSVVAASILDVYIHSDDVKRISTTLRLLFNFIMLMWIELNMRLRRDILRRLLLLSEYFTWEEMAIRDVHTGKLTLAGWLPCVNSIMKRWTFISLAVHILQSVARMLTSRDLAFQTWYPFNTSTSPAYEFIQITQVIALFRFSALSFALPHLYANLVCIACTQLHKIKDALSHVKQKGMEPQYTKGDDIPTEGDEHRMQNEVKNIVRHHQQVLSYMRMMQDYMSAILGGILLFLMLLLCTAAFTAVLNLGDTTDMTQSLLVYICAMGLSLVYCGFGTLLSDVFDSVRHAAWNSDWVGTPTKYQYSISFIILISNKGFELNAWNVVPVSNSTFMSMINESMSLFMFLLTMKEKNEKLH